MFDNFQITSCTSSNPGYPDMANAPLRYQTINNYQTPHHRYQNHILYIL